MPSLADLVNASKQDLPVTMRHERWLIEGSKITPPAALFAQRALNGEVGGNRARKPLFRASGMGSCRRKQIFSCLGTAKKELLDGKTANIFLTGNFIHLKWQVAGLSAGWLAEAEVPVERLDLSYAGTLDGVLDDGTGCEIKSINTRGFSMVMDRRSPLADHLLQAHTYMLLKGLEIFSFIYEDKNSQEWKEFRVYRDDHLTDSVTKEMVDLNDHWNSKTLPDVKPDCLKRDGFEYRNCPFKDVCLKMKRWPGE